MSSVQPRGLGAALSVIVCIIVASLTAWLMTCEMRSHQASNFSNESLQTRFMSYATTISATRRLSVAQLKQVEVFERKSGASLFWNYVQLPDVVVRATVPVEYLYYVDLNERWEFTKRDTELLVVAPALKFNTPAADVSALNFEVRQGSMFRNERDVAVGLQKELTPLLEQRATFNQHLVRETARKELTKIITDWMGAEAPATIQVRFADETPVKERQAL